MQEVLVGFVPQDRLQNWILSLPPVQHGALTLTNKGRGLVEVHKIRALKVSAVRAGNENRGQRNLNDQDANEDYALHDKRSLSRGTGLIFLGGSITTAEFTPAGYRSGEPLRHPKSSATNDFPAAC